MATLSSRGRGRGERGRRSATAPATELSRKVRLHQLDEQSVRLIIEAEPEEREALRRRFDLEALDSLTGEVVLERLDVDGTYRLHGELRAAVTQLCVVTLEPIEAVVEGPFTTTFIEDAREAAAEEFDFEEELDEDPPEPFSGDAIDVGEAVVQQFATMLDPYPRHPDAALEPEHSSREVESAPSPFAELEKLKAPRSSGAE